MSTKTRSNGAHQSSSDIVPPVTDSTGASVELSDRYQLFASFFDQLYIEKDVFVHEDSIVVRWPRKLDAPADYNFRLQRTNGRIYADAEGKEGDCGDRTLTSAVSIPDGEYELILMPSPNEYYVQGVRFQRKIPLSVVGSDYSTTAYGTYVERQIELLRYAVTIDDGLFSEIAKMTLGWWERIDIKKTIAAADGVANYEEDHLARLIALLGMAERYDDTPGFPTEIRQPLADRITAFPYCEQQYAERTGRTLSDPDKLLLAACELLAGQFHPDRTFTCSQQTGLWHRQRAEDTVLRWLQQAATVGFADASSHSLAQILTTLSHLIDLADSDAIWDLAAIVIDKVLVTLSLNSFQGVYGAGQIATNDTTYVPDGHVSPLAGVARLMWGIGAWNQHLAAPVSMCSCQGYQQPPLIAALANEPDPAGMWASERHPIAAQSAEHPPQTLHKAIYRTPDYLLCSAQDFQPGQSSQGAQSWQATLGADATVFVNHPATGDLEQAGRGGYWRSGLLPRVAQHRDILIALYALPESDPSGFTRAYFPTFAFDEHQIGSEWAFAAKDDAYIALACSAPLQLVQDGPAANRELRAAGHSVAWLCQMGRKADYDSFANFRKRVLAARVTYDGLSVSYRQLQGDTLTFDWNNALVVNGDAQQLQCANHYEGPNCVTDSWPASQMVVVHGDQAIQLVLADT